MAHTRLTTDASVALETLDAAVRLRAAHDSFDLALHLDDDRGRVAAILARDVCRGKRDLHARRAALDEIGSADATIGHNPLLRFATMDIATKATMRDVAMLARSLVFRSWAELRRAVMNFDILPRSYIIESPNDTLVPQPIPRKSPDGSVLIWAPDEPVEQLYLILTAAVETGRVVRVVCKDGDLANIPAEIVAHGDAARALSRASVCVAASLSDPAPAIALAQYGIPLCATFTSGAYESVEAIASYRSWSISSATSAIAFALAAPPPALAPTPPVRVVATEAPAHDVLVTVIVRTEGAMSQRTANSIAGQSHSNHKVVVASSARALREACSSARGSYVAILRDGDVLFREALTVLVDAAENSHAELVYGDGLLGYLVDAPGPPSVIGYSVLERIPATARAMSACDEFVGTYFRVLFRRETLDRFGLRDDLDSLMIYDAFLRMLDRGAAIRVDDVCGISYRLLDGRIPNAPSVALAPEYESIYARVSAADASVSAARAAVRQHLQSHERIGLRPPPLRLNPPRPMP